MAGHCEHVALTTNASGVFVIKSELFS